ncbi:hypothetical protein [Pseudomonas parafulva]|uniref:Uncharacterized protein n=1 Tax=Pseudomonas parafulva TaxID=157782 RepID=A0ABN4XSP2_9PSED|nr:hypothetical protein [Pseudomonas parafulva]AQW68227.1 hypothetical protein B2J77_08380 [Pseudomonas parafulva]WHU44703.1 hypothetical protein OXL99_12930 [Pseudomonas fulva]
MLHDERSAQLSATLYDITIIEITCRSISPESLAQEIDAFFFDFIDDQSSSDAMIDLSRLPSEHAQALFDAFMAVSQERGYRFGIAYLGCLSDYEGWCVPLDHYPLRQFAQHLLGAMDSDALHPELRDFKFAADLGL